MRDLARLEALPRRRLVEYVMDFAMDPAEIGVQKDIREHSGRGVATRR